MAKDSENPNAVYADYGCLQFSGIPPLLTLKNISQMSNPLATRLPKVALIPGRNSAGADVNKILIAVYTNTQTLVPVYKLSTSNATPEIDLLACTVPNSQSPFYLHAGLYNLSKASYPNNTTLSVFNEDGSVSSVSLFPNNFNDSGVPITPNAFDETYSNLETFFSQLPLAAATKPKTENRIYIDLIGLLLGVIEPTDPKVKAVYTVLPSVVNPNDNTTQVLPIRINILPDFDSPVKPVANVFTQTVPYDIPTGANISNIYAFFVVNVPEDRDDPYHGILKKLFDILVGDNPQPGPRGTYIAVQKPG